MYSAIKYIYPNIQDAQFLLQDDGDGPYIKSWDYSEPQPTAEQLDAVSEQVIFDEIWALIKSERDRRLQLAGYKVGAHWFHSDTFSRSQQIALTILGANIPAGTLWKTMSGDFVPMTQALAGQIFAAAAASDIAIFGKAEQHKAAMEASPLPKDYDYLVDWPLGYGE